MIDRVAQWCMHHWLLFANGLVLLYGGLPWLSPLLITAGYPEVGHLLFRLYTPFCHQQPEQSFFWLGHQVAFCHREAAMYTSLFVGGLVYARVRGKLRPARWRIVGLLLLPMLLDGTSHMMHEMLPSLGLRGGHEHIGSLNWWLRMITGVLFAVAVVTGVYPRIERDLRGKQA